MELNQIESVDNLPVMAIGNQILRTKSCKVDEHSEEIKLLIQHLWNTLSLTGGVGLAAPQVNSESSIFVVSSDVMYKELNEEQRKNLFAEDVGVREVFINPVIVSKSDNCSVEMESCLSVPGIAEPVKRSWEITIEYLDGQFVTQRKKFAGYTARVIQHEYDHLQGVLFFDHLSPIKKKLLRKKLHEIRSGRVNVNYPIVYES